MGVLWAMGLCWGCRQLFSFNPLKVPSFKIGPDNKPSEDGVRQPICENCFDRFNQRRVAAGLPRLVALPGAYEPAEEGEAWPEDDDAY